MLSEQRKVMIQYLQNLVVPILRIRGFQGSFPHFRRLTSERIHLMTFQFDKWGGGFVIEIANSSPGGYTTQWGKFIQPAKLSAHDVPNRIRIQPDMNNPDNSTDYWFRYDKESPSAAPKIYLEVCQDVISKLDLAEIYWKTGESN